MARRTNATESTQVERLRKALAREKAKSASLGKSLDEALEQQAATAEILKVISNSPTDLKPVFAAMCASAARLCDAYDAAIWRVDREVLRGGRADRHVREVLR